jgi:hypothetical protein
LIQLVPRAVAAIRRPWGVSAAELGITEVTLQIHRGRIMHKMEAASLAELVRMAGTLGIQVTHSRRTQD